MTVVECKRLLELEEIIRNNPEHACLLPALERAKVEGDTALTDQQLKALEELEKAKPKPIPKELELSERTKKWITKWLWGEPSKDIKLIPSEEIIKEILKFKPTNPVMLYRVAPIKELPKQLVSYTYSKEYADVMVENAEIEKKKVKLIKRLVYPKEILVDFTRLPLKIQEELETVNEVVVARGKMKEVIAKIEELIEYKKEIPKGLENLIGKPIKIVRTKMKKTKLGEYTGDILINRNFLKIPKSRPELYGFAPKTERDVVCHELGHAIATEGPEELLATFNEIKGKEIHPKFNVTGDYGTLTWEEDFAESFSKWVNYPAIFRETFPLRAEFFDKLGVMPIVEEGIAMLKLKDTISCEIVKKLGDDGLIPKDDPSYQEALQRYERGEVPYDVKVTPVRYDEIMQKWEESKLIERKIKIVEEIKEINLKAYKQVGSYTAIMFDDIDAHDRLVKEFEEINKKLEHQTAKDAKAGKPITFHNVVRAGKPEGIFYSDSVLFDFGKTITTKTLKFDNPAVFENQWDAIEKLFSTKERKKLEKDYKKLQQKLGTYHPFRKLGDLVEQPEIVKFWSDLDQKIIQKAVALGHDGIIYQHDKGIMSGEYVDLTEYKEVRAGQPDITYEKVSALLNKVIPEDIEMLQKKEAELLRQGNFEEANLVRTQIEKITRGVDIGGNIKALASLGKDSKTVEPGIKIRVAPLLEKVYDYLGGKKSPFGNKLGYAMGQIFRKGLKEISVEVRPHHISRTDKKIFYRRDIATAEETPRLMIRYPDFYKELPDTKLDSRVPFRSIVNGYRPDKWCLHLKTGLWIGCLAGEMHADALHNMGVPTREYDDYLRGFTHIAKDGAVTVAFHLPLGGLEKHYDRIMDMMENVAKYDPSLSVVFPPDDAPVPGVTRVGLEIFNPEGLPKEIVVRISEVGGKVAYQRVAEITTKVLNKLGDREFVSAQFISDLTNAPDLKQPERDLLRKMLKESDLVGKTKVNVPEFKTKIRAELLPLYVKETARWEGITLPDETRGEIGKYTEHIYQSPIETPAGEIHFSGEIENYFAHTRIEDLPTQRNMEKGIKEEIEGREKSIEYNKTELLRHSKIMGIFTSDRYKKYNITKLLQDEAKEFKTFDKSFTGYLTDTHPTFENDLQSKFLKKEGIDLDYAYIARFYFAKGKFDIKKTIEEFQEYEKVIKSHIEKEEKGIINAHQKLFALTDVKSTRRIIELQSDLYQRGRYKEIERDIAQTFKSKQEGIKYQRQTVEVNKICLEKLIQLSPREKSKIFPSGITNFDNLTKFVDKTIQGFGVTMTLSGISTWSSEERKEINSYSKVKRYIKANISLRKGAVIELRKDLQRLSKRLKTLSVDMPKIEAYKNTWFERIIKEEIRRASEDGINILRFPTGETAMLAEGLYKGSPFTTVEGEPLTWDGVETGEEIYYGNQLYIVTEGYERMAGFKFTPIDNIKTKFTHDALVSDVEDMYAEQLKDSLKNDPTGIEATDIKEMVKKGVSVEKAKEKWVTSMVGAHGCIDYLNDVHGEDYVFKDIRGDNYYILKDPSIVETYSGDLAEGELDIDDPIYRFYEKEIAKTLKRLRPDMKEIVDENGVSWREIEVKPEDAHRPIEAFDAMSNVVENAISNEEAEKIVRQYLSIEEAGIEFVRNITTPDGQKALGSYRDQIIRLGRNPTETTALHEAFHAHWDLIVAPERKTEIINEIKKKYDIKYDEMMVRMVSGIIVKSAPTNDYKITKASEIEMPRTVVTMEKGKQRVALKVGDEVQNLITKEKGTVKGVMSADDIAQERLADDFPKFVRKEKTFKGKIKEFFKDVWEKIRALVHKEDKVRGLYRDIMKKKRENMKKLLQAKWKGKNIMEDCAKVKEMGDAGLISTGDPLYPRYQESKIRYRRGERPYDVEVTPDEYKKLEQRWEVFRESEIFRHRTLTKESTLEGFEIIPVKDTYGSLWIAPDGRIWASSLEGGIHGAVAQLLIKDKYPGLKSEDAVEKYQAETGMVRVIGLENETNIDINSPLTKEQINSIHEIIRYHSSKSFVYDIREEGIVIKSMNITPVPFLSAENWKQFIKDYKEVYPKEPLSFYEQRRDLYVRDSVNNYRSLFENLYALYTKELTLSRLEIKKNAGYLPDSRYMDYNRVKTELSERITEIREEIEPTVKDWLKMHEGGEGWANEITDRDGERGYYSTPSEAFTDGKVGILSTGSWSVDIEQEIIDAYNREVATKLPDTLIKELESYVDETELKKLKKMDIDDIRARLMDEKLEAGEEYWMEVSDGKEVAELLDAYGWDTPVGKVVWDILTTEGYEQWRNNWGSELERAEQAIRGAYDRLINVDPEDIRANIIAIDNIINVEHVYGVFGEKFDLSQKEMDELSKIGDNIKSLQETKKVADSKVSETAVLYRPEVAPAKPIVPPLKHIKPAEYKSKVEIVLKQKGVAYVKDLKVTSTNDIADIFGKLKNSTHEKFYVCSMQNGKIVNIDLVAMGNVNAINLRLPEIFTPVMLSNADSFWVVHNHPSGNSKPSDDDLRVTNNIVKLSNLLGIKFEAHIIMNRTDYSIITRDMATEKVPYEPIEGKIEVPVVEPEYRKTPTYRGRTFGHSDDVRKIAKKILDTNEPTLVAFYLDPRLKEIARIVFVGDSIEYVEEVAKEVIIGGICTKASKVIMATNIDLPNPENIAKLVKIGKIVSEVGNIECIDTVGETISLKDEELWVKDSNPLQEQTVIVKHKQFGTGIVSKQIGDIWEIIFKGETEPRKILKKALDVVPDIDESQAKRMVHRVERLKNLEMLKQQNGGVIPPRYYRGQEVFVHGITPDNIGLLKYFAVASIEDYATGSERLPKGHALFRVNFVGSYEDMEKVRSYFYPDMTGKQISDIGGYLVKPLTKKVACIRINGSHLIDDIKDGNIFGLDTIPNRKYTNWVDSKDVIRLIPDMTERKIAKAKIKEWKKLLGKTPKERSQRWEGLIRKAYGDKPIVTKPSVPKEIPVKISTIEDVKNYILSEVENRGFFKKPIIKDVRNGIVIFPGVATDTLYVGRSAEKECGQLIQEARTKYPGHNIIMGEHTKATGMRHIDDRFTASFSIEGQIKRLKERIETLKSYGYTYADTRIQALMKEIGKLEAGDTQLSKRISNVKLIECVDIHELGISCPEDLAGIIRAVKGYLPTVKIEGTVHGTEGIYTYRTKIDELGADLIGTNIAVSATDSQMEQWAIRHSGQEVVVLHTHYGDPTPDEADIQFFKKLTEHAKRHNVAIKGFIITNDDIFAEIKPDLQVYIANLPITSANFKKISAWEKTDLTHADIAVDLKAISTKGVGSLFIFGLKENGQIAGNEMRLQIGTLPPAHRMAEHILATVKEWGVRRVAVGAVSKESISFKLEPRTPLSQKLEEVKNILTKENIDITTITRVDKGVIVEDLRQEGSILGDEAYWAYRDVGTIPQEARLYSELIKYASEIYPEIMDSVKDVLSVKVKELDQAIELGNPLLIQKAESEIYNIAEPQFEKIYHLSEIEETHPEKVASRLLNYSPKNMEELVSHCKFMSSIGKKHLPLLDEQKISIEEVQEILEEKGIRDVRVSREGLREILKKLAYMEDDVKPFTKLSDAIPVVEAKKNTIKAVLSKPYDMNVKGIQPHSFSEKQEVLRSSLNDISKMCKSLSADVRVILMGSHVKQYLENLKPEPQTVSTVWGDVDATLIVSPAEKVNIVGSETRKVSAKYLNEDGIRLHFVVGMADKPPLMEIGQINSDGAIIFTEDGNKYIETIPKVEKPPIEKVPEPVVEEVPKLVSISCLELLKALLNIEAVDKAVEVGQLTIEEGMEVRPKVEEAMKNYELYKQGKLPKEKIDVEIPQEIADKLNIPINKKDPRKESQERK